MEPIYEFVKGQGWVTTKPGEIFTDADGYEWRVENRKPVMGERWNLYGRNSTLEQLLPYFKNSRIAKFHPWNDQLASVWGSNEGFWVTFTRTGGDV